MTLPPLLPWKEIHTRLPEIFPEGSANREHSIWEIAAKTIFVLLYVGAVEGTGVWLRPDQVTRMTDTQAALTNDSDRVDWVSMSMKSSKGLNIPDRWYAVNTRESIRDDTIRYALLQNGAVIDRPVATTSSAGRYALQAEFAELLSPDLDDATFRAKAAAWREKHLNAGALARIPSIGCGPL